jgi:hypothetical protein
VVPLFALDLKENVKTAQDMLAIAAKNIETENRVRALEAVQLAIRCITLEFAKDFQTSPCSCGHLFGGHGLASVPRGDDDDPTSVLFLNCDICSKSCVELVSVPMTLE